MEIILVRVAHLDNNKELVHILWYRCQALLQGEVDLVSSRCKFLGRALKILIQAFSVLCQTCHNIAATLVRVMSRRIIRSNIVLVNNVDEEMVVNPKTCLMASCFWISSHYTHCHLQRWESGCFHQRCTNYWCHQ